jgi:hypothetical protein
MEEPLKRVVFVVSALMLVASPATALERSPGLGGSFGGDHKAGQSGGERGGGDRDHGSLGRDWGGLGRDRGGLGRDQGGFNPGRSFSTQRHEHSGRSGDRD